MDVEDGHEYTDPGAGTFKVRRLVHRFHLYHLAVGRRNHNPLTGRNQTIRVPEKTTDKTGGNLVIADAVKWVKD